MAEHGWIGVDLDGTLAVYDEWRGPEHIGEPVPAMLARVKMWLWQGIKVKIMTARAGDPKFETPIRLWLRKHDIGGCDITNQKDFDMIELWDDRCVQVEPNTGRRMDGQNG